MANPQIQNDPVYSLPHLYISGLNISVASNTVIAIAPGQARDSQDNIDMPVGFPNLQGNVNPPALNNLPMVPLFVNSAVVGANGLDTGTLAASTVYAIYLIGDSRGYKNVAGLLSLYSNAFPIMPNGYDSYRLLGFVQTNGSTHFVAADVVNQVNAKAFYLKPEVSVLSGGNSTTFAAIDLSAAVPGAAVTSPAVSIAILDVQFTPAAIGDVVQFRPGNSTATANLVTVVGVAANVPQQQYVQVVMDAVAGDATVDYLVTSSSDSVNVLVFGYIEDLT